MPHKSLTHKDLSRHLGVSETTVKSYRRKFPGCIPVASQGKPIRFNAEALAVCKRIRDLFDLGLSIPEVHARLAGEFPWITLPEACPPPGFEANMDSAANAEDPETAPVLADSNSADGEPRPDLPLIVSNLAKSVISLSRQQAALLKRLDSLEAKMDSSLGRAGESDTRQSDLAADQPAPVPAPEAEAQLADKLDGIERTLEQTMHLLGNYVEAVQGLVQPAPEVAPSPPSKEPRAHAPKISEEYLRHLATLPLVHKNERNGLAHLGDRSRGVYTLNDLKAVFAQACQPPEHYTAYWHVEKNQTWFVLEQPENPQGHALFLHIKLVRDSRGAEAAQITNMIIDGQEEHPATLYKTIQDMLG